MERVLEPFSTRRQRRGNMCFSPAQKRLLGNPAENSESYYEIDAEIAATNVRAQLRTYTTHCPTEREFEISENLLMLMLDSSHPEGGPSFAIERQGRHMTHFPGLYFLPRGLELKISATPGETRFVLCEISDSLLADVEIDRGDLVRGESMGLPSPVLKKGLLSLLREINSSHFAASMMVESMGTMLCIEMARHLHQRHERPGSGGLAAWQLRRVREVVADSRARITIGQLAHLCGVSVRQFVRAFKQSTGTTAHAYVEQVRFEKARQQLLHSDRSIKQIAGDLGFRSSNNFSEAFRRVCGTSPTEFRALAR